MNKTQEIKDAAQKLHEVRTAWKNAPTHTIARARLMNEVVKAEDILLKACDGDVAQALKAEEAAEAAELVQALQPFKAALNVQLEFGRNVQDTDNVLVQLTMEQLRRLGAIYDSLNK